MNACGYCLGGTLLAATLAYMAVNKDKRIASATFFTTMLDFSQPGELGVFLDDKAVLGLEKKMNERGYLEGSEMAGTFNMLRANDLIWSFVVNNYLMGKDPFPFDLLFWNSDSTRMPAKMHSFYLRNMYIKNLLKEPGAIELLGTSIDLTKIKVPTYFISTLEDHIAPWKSTYSGACLMGGDTRFVLGGSGHIAGIVNPPVANKYGYWVGKGKALPESAEEWLANTDQQAGSWWTDWQAWVTRARSGNRCRARPRQGQAQGPGRCARLLRQASAGREEGLILVRNRNGIDIVIQCQAVKLLTRSGALSSMRSAATASVHQSSSPSATTPTPMPVDRRHLLVAP